MLPLVPTEPIAKDTLGRKGLDMKPMYAPLLLLTILWLGNTSQPNDYSYEGTNTLSCNDTVRISVDALCQALVTPDDLLEGSIGDPNDYSITIESGINTLPNPVPGDHLNELLTATITELTSGNSCWSTLIIEDKTGPEFQCPSDTISVDCWADLNAIAPPVAADNCSTATPELLNQSITDEELCELGTALLARSWTAIDDAGNIADFPCKQYIHLQRPNEIDFPNDLIWSCTQFDLFPNIAEATSLHPSLVNLPEDTAPIDASSVFDPGVLAGTGSGSLYFLNAPTCNYSVSHADVLIGDCGSAFEIVRTWTVLDWCTNQVITENSQGEDNVQIIKIKDVTAPVITGPDTLYIPVDTSTVCLSQADIPLPVVTEDCSTFSLHIFTPIGEAEYVNGSDAANGASIPAPGLEPGFHPVFFQATNECGLIRTDTVVLEIYDPVAPAVFCDEITSVTLNAEGLAVVNASTFDDGSYDNCCLDAFVVRRMEAGCVAGSTDFGPDVTFCCDDLDNNPVTVVFRALDCYGNTNECMVTVNVEDKLPVQLLACPENLTITCHEYADELAAPLSLDDFSVLEQYGLPAFADNCGFTETYTVEYQVNVCGYGSIHRTWIAEDVGGNSPASCVQGIEVRHVSDWGVSFPADLIAQCTDSELPEFGEPEVFLEDCELIGVSFEDQLFTIVPDACYKIVRTWTVINWCIFEQNGSNLYLEFSEAEVGQDFDGDGDQDDVTFFDGVNDGPEPDGYIVFKQTIKVVDEEAPELSVEPQEYCIVETDCDTDIFVPGPDIFDCSSEFEITVTTDLPNEQGNGNYQDVPPGTYELLYEVWDECGNFSQISQNVEVIDCKLPTPVCITGADIVLMQTGMIEIPASTFDAGSYDNCPGPLMFSYSENPFDTTLWLGCSNLGQVNIEVWVTDQAGNQASCETFFFLFDNEGNACQALPVLAGLVYSTEEEAMPGVVMSVNDENIDTTDADGYFQTELPYDGDYTLLPVLDDDPLNGVTTFDMVLISKHILGVDPLPAPFARIAADANNSGSITTSDIVEIQKIILGLQDGFSDLAPWRFVPISYQFPNPDDPWQEIFPEFLQYNNLTDDVLDADFTGIKVGDVNGSAIVQ